VRCVRCVVRFESSQRNPDRRSADCQLEFLARVYGGGRYEFRDGNRHGATSGGGGGTDPVVRRFAIECGQRGHLHADLEQHRCERLYRQRRLDGRASRLGYDNSRSLDDCCDLYIGLHRYRWHGDTLGHHHDRAKCPDADSRGITAERRQRREFDTDVERDQRDGLYGVGIVERDQSNLGNSNNRRADGQRELHADVHGRRRIGLADGGGDRDRSATDAHSDGVSGERAIGRLVESDVEYYERYKLFGIRCLERCQGNLRHPEYRCAQRQFELHARMCRRRRHRDANGLGDGDRRDTFRDPVGESAGGFPQHQRNTVVDQRQRDELRSVRWLVGYQGNERLGERRPDHTGHHLHAQLYRHQRQCCCNDDS